MAMAGGLRIDKKFGGLVLAAMFLVIIAQVLPFVGIVIEDATPTAGATSDWNATYNTDLPSGVDTWSTILTVLGGGLSLSAIFYAISPIVGKSLGMG